MIAATLKFDATGTGHCLFTEVIELSAIGKLEIARASTVEFNNESQLWQVKTPEGLLLFSHPSRQACLGWEHQYFNR
jgi:hypothetical protein